MATGFWKAVGARLVDAGAAYLQQVRMVEELRRLPAAEARERFSTYVRGLSDTARAGLSVTLTALSNQERGAEAKRFIESLRQMLAQGAAPGAARLQSAAAPVADAAAPNAPAAPAARAASRATPVASYDDDLERFSRWCELEGDSLFEAVQAHLDALDLPGLKSLRDHVGQIAQRLPAAIEEHRENEARLAAGRFVEDQMHYRQMRLMGAPPDADWLRKLQALEGAQGLCQGLVAAIDATVAERTAPPPPVALEPAPSPKAEPPAASRSAEPGLVEQLEQLKSMLEQFLASGQVRGERATAFRRLLGKMEALLTAHRRGELEPPIIPSTVSVNFAG